MQRNFPGFERRRHARYVLQSRQNVSRVQMSPTEVLLGRTIDVSDGGIKMILDTQVQPGQVFKCELAIPELPVRIPTLTQARWCLEMSREHVCGLRFLI
jgi:hypothetical protein